MCNFWASVGGLAEDMFGCTALEWRENGSCRHEVGCSGAVPGVPCAVRYAVQSACLYDNPLHPKRKASRVVKLSHANVQQPAQAAPPYESDAPACGSGLVSVGVGHVPVADARAHGGVQVAAGQGAEPQVARRCRDPVH